MVVMAGDRKVLIQEILIGGGHYIMQNFLAGLSSVYDVNRTLMFLHGVIQEGTL